MTNPAAEERDRYIQHRFGAAVSVGDMDAAREHETGTLRKRRKQHCVRVRVHGTEARRPADSDREI